MMQCPCRTGQEYQECCGKYHAGASPENALLLMRSRYCAYALKLADYIMQTTHPDNPHYMKDKKLWKEQILQFSRNSTFEKLVIVQFQDGSTEAFVTFIAHLGSGSFMEKSRFLKVNDKWLYRDGLVTKPQ